jgi:hypothetical protein
MRLPPQVAAVTRQSAGQPGSSIESGVTPCKFTGDELWGLPHFANPKQAQYTDIFCGRNNTNWCYCPTVQAYECCKRGCDDSTGVCKCK